MVTLNSSELEYAYKKTPAGFVILRWRDGGKREGDISIPVVKSKKIPVTSW